MEKNAGSEILNEILNMGVMLLGTGAEIKRVEQTINRLGMAFGAEQMDVFAITSSIVVTMTLPDGSEITQTRRIENPAVTDLARLEQLNALSRRCCERGMSIQELKSEMQQIRNTETGEWYVVLGSVLAAAAFSVFFGGTAADGITAGVFAVFICFCQNVLARYCPNRLIFNLLCSMMTGFGIYGVTAVLSFLHADKVVIGDIMLLIPGIAITNAVKDMMVGDTVAGTMRFLESLLWAGALAGGFMVSMWIMGGVL